MPRVTPCLVLGGTLLLAACAAPPPGPSVMALPGQGKSFDQFQRDDVGCRQYSDQQTGYGGPAAAANQAGVGNALLTTGLGAAAGALIGAAAGNAGAGLQAQYDMAYSQCMYGHDNRVPAAPSPYPPAPYPYAYAPYGPGYYPGY